MRPVVLHPILGPSGTSPVGAVTSITSFARIVASLHPKKVRPEEFLGPDSLHLLFVCGRRTYNPDPGTPPAPPLLQAATFHGLPLHPLVSHRVPLGTIPSPSSPRCTTHNRYGIAVSVFRALLAVKSTFTSTLLPGRARYGLPSCPRVPPALLSTSALEPAKFTHHGPPSVLLPGHVGFEYGCPKSSVPVTEQRRKR